MYIQILTTCRTWKFYSHPMSESDTENERKSESYSYSIMVVVVVAELCYVRILLLYICSRRNSCNSCSSWQCWPHVRPLRRTNRQLFFFCCLFFGNDIFRIFLFILAACLPASSILLLKFCFANSAFRCFFCILHLFCFCWKIMNDDGRPSVHSYICGIFYLSFSKWWESVPSRSMMSFFFNEWNNEFPL